MWSQQIVSLIYPLLSSFPTRKPSLGLTHSKHFISKFLQFFFFLLFIYYSPTTIFSFSGICRFFGIVFIFLFCCHFLIYLFFPISANQLSPPHSVRYYTNFPGSASDSSIFLCPFLYICFPLFLCIFICESQHFSLFSLTFSRCLAHLCAVSHYRLSYTHFYISYLPSHTSFTPGKLRAWLRKLTNTNICQRINYKGIALHTIIYCKYGTNIKKLKYAIFKIQQDDGKL